MRYLLLICITLTLFNAYPSGHSLVPANEINPKPLSVTFTYGHNGVIRTDDRFLAGESIFATVVALRYEVPLNGICNFKLRYSLIGQEGKIVFTSTSDNLLIELEGKANLAKAIIRCPLKGQIEVGKYDFVLELQDKMTKAIFRSSQPITILPKDEFALGDFCFCADTKSIVPLGTTFETCQDIFFCWRVYHPKEHDGHWELDFDIDILDANNKSIALPSETIKNKIPALNVDNFATQIPITIEEPGEYTVVLKMTDVISGKTESRSIPIRVIESLSDTLPALLQ